MDRDPQEKIWPYLLLAACLLALAIVAPRYWRWRDALAERAQRAAKVSTGKNVEANAPPYERELAAHDRIAAGKRHLDGPGAPALLTRDQLAQMPAFAGAGRELSSSHGGQLAPLGPPVANPFGEPDDQGDVLPPELPPEDQPRIEDVQSRLARRLRLAARERASQSNFAVTVWPRPTALIEQLQAISGDAQCENWAQSVLASLDALSEVDDIDSQRSQRILTDLAEQARAVRAFVLDVRPWPLQLEVISAAEALHRRVIIWQQVQALAHHHEPSHLVAHVSDDEIHARMVAALNSIPASVRQAWERYLRLDELRQSMAGDDDIAQRAEVARSVLQRMHAARLHKRQKQLLASDAMQRLDEALRRAATEPADTIEVVYAIEQYEQTRSLADAQRLAAMAARWRYTSDDGVEELVRRIDANYRGANARTAITGELLNRLLPAPETKTESVDETILGSYVSGERTVQTKLAVKLIPDANHWRMGMEARGTVHSNTTSFVRNASIFTAGTGRFAARKLIVADHHRVHVWPAAANVRYDGQLTGVNTALDGVPLVNRVARSRAMDGYYQSQYAAQQEVEERLRQRASEILDRQAHGPMFAAEAQLQQQLLRPLARASVEPTTVRLYTTDERIVGHWRMAGDNQLGGHTARPWAPQDSLFSLQIHETAINNTLAGLKLEGREETVGKLCSEVYAMFGARDTTVSDELPGDMTIRFADEEAVHVRLADGRMEVILQIAELSTERRVWRDLVVRNDYAPNPDSLDAPLMRDSSVRLKGERLGIRDQIALRGIFTKLFGNNERFPLIPAELAAHPNLADLAITQFIIRDGWLAVAVGPRREADGDGQTLDRQARRERESVR